MPYDAAGKPRGGMARMRHAEKAHSEPGAKEAKPTVTPAAPSKREEHEADSAMHAHSHKGGADDVSATPIHDVVKEHGPATHTFSEHDHEAGTHHTHTVHGKHHHHADHESAADAHEHLGHAVGAGEMDEDDETSPFAGTQSEEEEEQLEEQVSHGKAHRAIPGIG